MGTKTENEAGTETGTEAQRDEKPATGEVKDAKEAKGVKTDGRADSESPDTDTATATPTDVDADLDDDEHESENEQVAAATPAGSGVATGAAAVVSAGLGIISLTGSWVGTIAQARDSLYGQMETVQGAAVSTQIKQVYGDSWNANALVAGFFALVALIVGVVVLVRPAFGNPDRIPAQAPWVKSVAWAGVSLGVLGLLLAALKYTDILLAMPSGS
jgi:hypothetical protein